MAPMESLPLFVAPARYDDANAALQQVRYIYEASVEHLRVAVQRFVAGTDNGQRVRHSAALREGMPGR